MLAIVLRHIRCLLPISGRPITPHGLRAIFPTWSEDEGFPRELLEEALVYQIGTAVERAYVGLKASSAVGQSCRCGRTSVKDVARSFQQGCDYSLP